MKLRKKIEKSNPSKKENKLFILPDIKFSKKNKSKKNKILCALKKHSPQRKVKNLPDKLKKDIYLLLENKDLSEFSKKNFLKKNPELSATLFGAGSTIVLSGGKITAMAGIAALGGAVGVPLVLIGAGAGALIGVAAKRFLKEELPIEEKTVKECIEIIEILIDLKRSFRSKH